MNAVGQVRNRAGDVPGPVGAAATGTRQTGEFGPAGLQQDRQDLSCLVSK